MTAMPGTLPVMDMAIDILRHTPVWVWLVFVALVALGLAQTRDRQITLARVTTLPLLFIFLSLSGVLRNGNPWIALAAWAAGCGAVIGFARRAVAVRGATWSATTRRLHVPGSWVPLPLIVGLFSAKYAVAVTQALNPTLLTRIGPLVTCNLVFGAFAGMFWCRSDSLRRIARQENASPPPAAAQS
jgi:hypothetical protein